jgi:rod shape determining protein RodA
MKKTLEKIFLLRQYDLILIILVFILLVFSFASIYSIDLSRGESLTYFPTQLLALSIGMVALVIASRFHMTFYRAISKSTYVISFILLIAVLIFGDSIRGTTGWFRFGSLSFQPAEFAKLAIILTMGTVICRQGRRFDKLQFVIASGFLSIVFIFLILLQPDLGSALVLGGIWFGLIVLSGVKKRYIFAVLVLVIITFLFAWNYVFKPYQKDRLTVFVHPEEELLGAGYNVNQSIIAIGAGRLFGRGLGFGSQSQLHFLPEAQTDFIFSVIAEELGFVGTFVVLSLYTLLLLRLVKIAKSCRDDFGSYLVLGIVLLFFIQIIFNIGATTGLLPVTGLTLPFMSYGGSSLIINLLLIGVVESVARSSWENQDENVLYG